jgi:sulfur carrier protein
MQIILNGQSIESQQTALDQFLLEQGYSELSVATAHNQLFIACSDRSSIELNDGDRIEVVAPMQGG